MAIIKHEEQRVGVFIDTQNLYHSARNIYDQYVNFGAILDLAVGNRRLVRAIAYVITSGARDEVAFFDALAKFGIETREKELQVFAGGAKKADWDVGLAVDAIKLAPKLDAVVLVTGDGDFVPLVTYLQHMGIQVEIVTFGQSASARLIEVSDDFSDLSENPKAFLMPNRRKIDGGRKA